MKTAPPTVSFCFNFVYWILASVTLILSGATARAEAIGDHQFSNPDFASLLFASITLIGVGFILRRRVATRRK